jgi:hypothetical protein
MSYPREYDSDTDLYRCTGCGQWKDYDSFYENIRYKYGIMSKCKVCTALYHKNRYIAQTRPAPEPRDEYITDEELAALTGDHTQL